LLTEMKLQVDHDPAPAERIELDVAHVRAFFNRTQTVADATHDATADNADSDDEQHENENEDELDADDELNEETWSPATTNLFVAFCGWTNTVTETRSVEQLKNASSLDTTTESERAAVAAVRAWFEQAIQLVQEHNFAEYVPSSISLHELNVLCVALCRFETLIKIKSFEENGKNRLPFRCIHRASR
jgi:hypothetical protein